MTKDEFRQFLQRYKKGDCSAEEVMQVERWFAEISDDDLELSEVEKAEVRNRMLQNIRPALRSNDRRLRLGGWRIWRVAASITVFMIAGYALVRNAGLPLSSDLQNTHHNEWAFNGIENTTQQVLVHRLPDGSEVELQPESRISYDKLWSGKVREVRLVGEAFFSVVRDPDKPFFVYGGEIVTKVLGTSFRVKAPEAADRIEVEVKTGKVSVYQDSSGAADQEGGDANGVILTPNEKVEYFVKAGHWVTSLVDRPQPLSRGDEMKSAFVFSATPVKEVFRRIETAYDIQIIIENENAYTCTFTGDVGNMELYDMLQVVCRSIDARYEVKGTKILVSGSGCVL